MKKSVSFAFILFLLSMFMLGTLLVTTVSASTTHHVNPGESIQNAINLAQPGDTIIVHSGTYHELVVVNKSVSLIGEGKYNTIIDGGDIGNVIKVTSNNVSIQGFTIQESGCHCDPSIAAGIRVENSRNVNITNNLMTENGFGIMIHSSCEIIVARNDVIDNFEGINVGNSSDSVVYHNNFDNSLYQVASWGSQNIVWDDGYPSGGNYWSEYSGTDFKSGSGQNETGSDGIGDQPYEIGSWPPNTDRFPLMAPINIFDAGTFNNLTYYVDVISNSTVSDFNFNPDNYLISFDVTEKDGPVGFCRVTIPNELLWCDASDQWQVWINDTLIEDRKIMEDTDYTYIYFTYNHSIQKVEIVGFNVIPEFPKWTSILLILMVLTVAIAIHKRKLLKAPMRARYTFMLD